MNNGDSQCRVPSQKVVFQKIIIKDRKKQWTHSPDLSEDLICLTEKALPSLLVETTPYCS